VAGEGKRVAKAAGMPDSNTRWTLGALPHHRALILGQGALAQVRIDDLRADLAEVRANVRRLDNRLRAVEIAFGKVEQRLDTLERVIAPGDA